MADSKAAVLVLNGPNLNLLGRREPSTYGSRTLGDIERGTERLADELGLAPVWFQSNGEGALIDRVHAAADDGTALIIANPAAYTHTSVALRDAVLAVALPLIEVHLSNVHARDAFRGHSYFSDIALGTISGLGAQGYALALRAAAEYLTPTR